MSARKPQKGQTVDVVLRNDSAGLLGPWKLMFPEFLHVIGTVTSTPDGKDDPDLFGVLVPGSPVPLRVIDLRRVVSINGVKLVGTPELVEPQSVEVKGSKGGSYMVTSRLGVWECTCPGFNFHRSCKHITKVRDNA
jgi:hypothetical protein